MKFQIILIVFFLSKCQSQLNPRIRDEKYVGSLEEFDICLNDLYFFSTVVNSKINIVVCGNSHYNYCMTDSFFLISNNTKLTKTFYYGITLDEKVKFENSLENQIENNNIFQHCRNSLFNYYNLLDYEIKNNTIFFNDYEKRQGILECAIGCIPNAKKTYRKDIVIADCKFSENNFEIVVIFLSIFGVILLIGALIVIWKCCLSKIDFSCKCKLKLSYSLPTLPTKRIELTTINNPSLNNRLVLNQKIIEKKDIVKPTITPHKVRNNSISRLV
jgi:hypothetical protein